MADTAKPKVATKKTKKKVAKKKPGRKPGRPKTKKVGRKPGRPKGSKVAKKRGRPKGSKVAKRRGRPAGKKRGRKATAKSITIPVHGMDDLIYWHEMVTFLNNNKGKSFTVQMDGLSYSLHAGK